MSLDNWLQCHFRVSKFWLAEGGRAGWKVVDTVERKNVSPKAAVPRPRLPDASFVNNIWDSPRSSTLQTLEYTTYIKCN